MAAVVAAVLHSRKKRLSIEDVATASASQENEDVSEAAKTIAKAWKRAKSQLYVKKVVLEDRLSLESELAVGVTRLILFSIIFFLIIQANSIGIASSDKRAVANLLTDSLGLEDFREISSLEALRDFLPDLSSGCSAFDPKQHCIERLCQDRPALRNPELLTFRMECAPQAQTAVQILRAKSYFAVPSPKISLELPVADGDFSLCAWVEAGTSRHSILRKPLASDPSLSCWAWIHPNEFRYGAHDFHSTMEKPPDREEVVGGDPGSGGAGSSSGVRLTHEAVIFSNKTMAFYRNGDLLTAVTVPRALTDCLEARPLELGDSGLTLSSVKFYPRALLPAEVRDIFVGGQPLSELATGSSLNNMEEDPLDITVASINQAQNSNEQRLGEADLDAEVSSVLQISAGNRQSTMWTDPAWPPESSPAGVLLDGAKTEAILARRTREYALWEAGGRQRGFERVRTEEWRNDFLGSYWSMFENPLIWALNPRDLDSDPPYSGGTQLPNGGDVPGITVSFWYKPIHVDSISYCSVALLNRNTSARIQWQIEGHWNSYHVFAPEQFDDGWSTRGNLNGYTIFWNEETHQMDTSFISSTTTPGQADGPVVWRHTALVLDFEALTFTVYLDGRVFGIHELPSFWGNTSFPSFFQDLKLDAHTSPQTSYECKLAQMRMYPQALSGSDVQALQDDASWPDGSGVKQCVAEDIDLEWGDSMRLDDHGHVCEWYNTVRKTHSQVCTADAQRQCPLSCDGVRRCYNGWRQVQRDVPQRHRIFERAMHLSPRNNTHSLMCPSTRVAANSSLLGRCIARQEELLPVPDTQHPTRWDRADCDGLAARLDAEQCAWDGSWIPTFLAEFEQTRAFSVQLWMRAREGSSGMPHNFWPVMTFFSQLVDPENWIHIGQPTPTQEDMLIFEYFTEKRAEDAPYVDQRHRLRPLRDVPLSTEWTFVHFSFEEVGQDVRVCSAINSRSPSENDGGFCKTFLERKIVLGTHFLEAIEFSTELMVSPIEFTAQSFTLSEVQSRYYSNRPFMAKMLGPAGSELQRIAQRGQPSIKEVGKFDERVSLLAPPLIFQSRADTRSCASTVTTPFLEAQWELAKAVHCSASNCPGMESSGELSTCLGDELSSSYFGLQPTENEGEIGVADFLYTICDNDVVVRDGEVLETREFLDAQTKAFSIRVVLHVPSNGLTSVLTLSADCSGLTIEPSVDFTHLGFVESDKVKDVQLIYGIVFLCIALLIVLNLWTLHSLRRDKREFDVPIQNSELLEMAWDAGQIIILVAYCIVSIREVTRTEETAREVTQVLSAVPFADPNIEFQSKVLRFFDAMDEVQVVLANNRARTTFAFVIMVLMLVRILEATAVHPRVGILIATVKHGATDLYHFALLFIMVFFFFTYVAQWLFADSRDDFGDLETAMETQFYMILGEMPDGDWRDDPRLIVYVVFTNLVQFFLMLNFLLAIVVEAYMKSREAIETNEADQEIFYDIYLLMVGNIKSFLNKWPSRRALAHLLRTSVASKSINVDHLELQNIQYDTAKSIVEHYRSMEAIKADPPVWVLAKKTKMRRRASMQLQHGGRNQQQPALQTGQLLGQTRAVNSVELCLGTSTAGVSPRAPAPSLLMPARQSPGVGVPTTPVPWPDQQQVWASPDDDSEIQPSHDGVHGQPFGPGAAVHHVRAGHPAHVSAGHHHMSRH